MAHKLRAAQLQVGSAVNNDKPFSEHVPITRFIDDGFVVTKNADLVAVFTMRGVNHETSSTQDLLTARNRISKLLSRFDSGRYTFYCHAIRRKIDPLEGIDAVSENDFSMALDQHYSADLRRQEAYRLDYFISIVLSPERLPLGLSNVTAIFNSTKKDIATERRRREKDVRNIRQAAEAIEGSLGKFGIERLRDTVDDRKALLQLYTMLANGVWSSAPDSSFALDKVVPAGRITFRGETISLNGVTPKRNKHAAVLAISAYGDATELWMMDDILSEPCEYIITNVFQPFSRAKGLNKSKDAKARMEDAGDEASTLKHDLAAAADAIASGKLAVGQHHCTIAVIADSEARLSHGVSKCANAMQNAEVRMMREDVGMEAAWWSQQPGNMGYQTRSKHRIISAINAADLMSFHAFDQGFKTGLPWGGPVAVLQTGSQTPFNFSFHSRGDKSAGTTAVYGGSGSGKTALVNFLTSQTRRLSPAPDVIFFDKDRGADAFIHAMGGSYHILKPGQSHGFNPFEHINTQDERDWLNSFIQRMVKVDLEPEQQTRLADACRRTAEASVELRNFSDFASLFKSADDEGAQFQMKDLLKQWHGDGDLAWLFDNERDTFDINAKVIGFDMTSILGSDRIRSPLMDYLFHRIEQKIALGLPLIIVLDEAWALLNDAAFKDRIEDWIRTIRKYNGIVIFMTQEPAVAAKSVIAETLIQTVSNNIFFGNPQADEDTYMGKFRLTDAEFSIVSDTEPDSRTALIKSKSGSAIVSTMLNDAGPFMRVLSGSADRVQVMDQLKQTHPDDWLQRYMESEDV